MSERPDISVIIAAWRASEFIAPAIRSALSQDGVSLEVIVVDDASPDETLAAARQAGAGDGRLRLERMRANGGPSAARNRGIDLAHGRYLAVLDADDSFEPGRLAKLLAHAEDTGADLVADNMNRVAAMGAAGASGTPFLDEAALRAPREVTLAAYLDPATEAWFGENLGYLKPLFRAAFLDAHGVRYDASLRNSEDFYLVASLLAEGARFHLHPSRGYNYLVRPGSISHRLTPALTEAILSADAQFVARYGDGFDAAERAAAASRRRALHLSHAFECVIDALRRRDLGDAVAAIGTHPGAASHVAGRLASIAAGKIGSRMGYANREKTIQNANDQAAAQ